MPANFSPVADGPGEIRQLKQIPAYETRGSTPCNSPRIGIAFGVFYYALLDTAVDALYNMTYLLV